MRKAAAVYRVKHPRYNFKVSYKEVLPDGSPIRRYSYFVKKDEAKVFADEKAVELANHGTRHGTVEEDERAALIKFRVWASKRPDAPALSTLIENAMAAHDTIRPPHTVSEAIDARMLGAEKRKLSLRHQGDLKNRLDRFRAEFGDRQVADITLPEVDAWLHRLDVSAQTWTNYARVIGSLFTLAVKRGFLPINPLAGLERPKVVPKAPGILTPSQLTKLLTAADPAIRPHLILQAFCGLRCGEANRVCWKHIHIEGKTPYLEAPAEVTKTNRRRTCELPSCAVAWLKPLVGLPETPLAMPDSDYRKLLSAAATAAGIDWEPNLLRHSFGTYRLAITKSAAAVAEEMGNSPNVVRVHYNNIVSPKQALAYWRVMPPNTKSNVVQFGAQQKVS